ncbi:uncharacterized protein LOC100200796 [Hydra vulgaris]|uniref:uncharacterized protein LOC100200796 n=1 Tax=Hydra vulgaris TaxID=6087 RepID=UPI00019261B7|nr:uncharacterized protein LOC100200796 [Hydra vulgaris]
MDSQCNYDLVEEAGLQRLGTSRRKSATEKKLENLLKTAQPHQTNKMTRQMTFPNVVKEASKLNEIIRPVKLLQDDHFVESAGLQRISMSSKKSKTEKLLEQTLNTTPDHVHTPSDKIPEKLILENKENKTVSVLEGRLCTPEKVDERLGERIETEGTEVGAALTERSQNLSMYRLKNIDPPTPAKGNRISSRTQNLFQQYKVDIENSKADLLKRETTKELREIRLHYQNSTIENEREIEAARKERMEAERLIKFSSNRSIFAN